MNIAPTTNQINSIRAALWPFKKSIRELLDNAIDAEATIVTLDFLHAPREALIADNGHGCDDLHRMLAQGARQKKKDGKTGVYGMGAKLSFIWLSRQTQIASSARGIRRQVWVDWEALRDAGVWEIDPPQVAPTSELPGTAITLRGLLHQPEDWAAFLDGLAQTYRPALRTGAFQIRLRRPASRRKNAAPPHWETIKAPPEPELEPGSVVTHTLVGPPLAGGRQAIVTMGILARPEEQPLQGTWLALSGARFLGEGSSRLGLGPDPTPGLYVYIELEPREVWGVDVLKDGIPRQRREELARAISGYLPFAELIAKAQSRAESVPIDCAFLDLLDQEIRGQKRLRLRGKAKRSPPENRTGTIKGTGRGSPHQRAEKVQPGDRLDFDESSPEEEARSQRYGFRLQFNSATPENPLFDLQGSCVFVNRDHPFCVWARGDRDILYPHALEHFQTQRLLKGIETFDFPEEISSRAARHSRQQSDALACYARAAQRADSAVNEEAV